MTRRSGDSTHLNPIKSSGTHAWWMAYPMTEFYVVSCLCYSWCLGKKKEKQLSYDPKYWPDFLRKCQSSGRKRKEEWGDYRDSIIKCWTVNAHSMALMLRRSECSNYGGNWGHWSLAHIPATGRASLLRGLHFFTISAYLKEYSFT